MDSPIILAIETSSEQCVVSLAQGEHILRTLSNSEEKSHSKKLLCTIEELLANTNISMSELNAIAISEGPGSYTGLRIGISVAKGLAMALDIPILSINTLYAMACAVANLRPDYDLYIPMLDARRMEVYTMMIDSQCRIIETPMAIIIEPSTFKEVIIHNRVLCFGSGSDKFQSVFIDGNVDWLAHIVPASESLHAIALEKYHLAQFADTLYLEPYYLKEFHSTATTK